MQITHNVTSGYIEVWLTNAEQKTINRKALTQQLLTDAGNPPKCKVAFFLSGTKDLYEQIEALLTSNAKS